MNRHTAEARPALNPYDARLERAQMKLIRSIANFHPTRVIGSRADKADCDNAAHDITECFASPFRDAIDGNATHILRKAGEELAEAGRDGARADYNRSFIQAAE